ncbi:MAG: hypothetical protein BJ554DRAFT_3502 [Olpidium bornovanus]|uniref:Uncharacterized protein n=1 Tax=Olpidium bornovanus TaxID=278681 RepID=A0A8H8A0L0_9FUNG|nr:MAG: hypothetical protein BJ554DRAFT_3502 [Olpidium bornovanus]
MSSTSCGDSTLFSAPGSESWTVVERAPCRTLSPSSSWSFNLNGASGSGLANGGKCIPLPYDGGVIGPSLS